jgi:hypothetical protein
MDYCTASGMRHGRETRDAPPLESVRGNTGQKSGVGGGDWALCAYVHDFALTDP